MEAAVGTEAAGGGGGGVGGAAMDVSNAAAANAAVAAAGMPVTVEEMAAAAAIQAMEAEADNELKQLDEMALKMGMCEDHVMELDYTFRAWDFNGDGYISVDDVKRVLMNINPDLPIEEATELQPLFRLCGVPYHPNAHITRARFLKHCLNMLQWSFSFVDGLDLRVLPMGTDAEKLVWHHKLVQALTSSRRYARFADQFGPAQVKAIQTANTLLKEFNSIRQMLRSSQQDHVEKGLDFLGQMLNVYSVCPQFYVTFKLFFFSHFVYY
jgi:hypothetical protein